jgi:hypothetical protein
MELLLRHYSVVELLLRHYSVVELLLNIRGQFP